MPYDGTISAQRYRDILKNQLLPSIQQLNLQLGYPFHQGLAKPHAARTAKAWIPKKLYSCAELGSEFTGHHSYGGFVAKVKKEVRQTKQRDNQQLKRIICEECKKFEFLSASD